ncbi:MAG: DUF4082 domain-containing protein [bacterium]
MPLPRKLIAITAMLVTVPLSEVPTRGSAVQENGFYEAIQSVDTSDTTGSGEGRTQGWAFTVENLGANEWLSVTELGIYDHNSDELFESHEVGIWDSAQSLLGSVTVPTDGILIGRFRYESLDEPFSLYAGETYVIGADYLNDGSSDDQFVATGEFTPAPHINRSEGRNSSSSSDVIVFPTETPQGGRFGPNFRFTVVPEPSSLVLALLLGIGVIAGYCRRRRR